jgi:predicted nucleic acid-binding protein
LIILDTNVISEPLEPNCDPLVRDWLDGQAIASLYITTTVLAELLAGIERLPVGRRRAGLQDGLDTALAPFITSRILPFDIAAARAYGSLLARARAAGKAIFFSDGQIAAIALVKNFAVATRDAGPFLAAGVKVIDPWRR